MKIVWATTVAVLLSACVSGLAAQGWDKKTIEKMLSDGAKKMNSANPKDREDGIGYIGGYITCDYKKQYLPVIVKALKDANPEVRKTASHTLTKIEGKEAMLDH